MGGLASGASAFPLLLSPIRIGGMSLRNRLVMSPMENLYATRDGLPSPRTIAYFAERARGGVGLVTLGASTIDARHPEVLNSLCFSDDAGIDGHRALVDAVHAHGAKIQPQLVHPGPDGLGPELFRVEALGPSAIQSYLTKTTSREITREELAGIVDLFRAAAVRVLRAGYDGIELHAAHGYMLLGSFLSPWRNARRDEYGARSAAGRVRAVAEVVRAIKAETGDALPITLRISGHERVPGGREPFDTARLAPALVEAGVDAFHVSGGVIDRFVTQMVNGAEHPAALNVAAAAEVKRAVAVPVIAVGRIHDPVLAERILRDGDADLIAMARPLLADPELPEKLRSGRAGRVRRCISCQNCIDAMETRLAMDCAVNARTGREAELPLGRATRAKRVLVVGGGPGGLEAARVAAERGHAVSLYERSRQLGGALVLASAVHPENEPFLRWLTSEVRRLGVRVHTGVALDADGVLARVPEAVIVATGGRLETPRLPGDELPHVLSGALLRELLAGRVSAQGAKLPGWMRAAARLLAPLEGALRPGVLRAATRVFLPLGRCVVIVGADLAALELAELLARRGRRVSVLEPGEQVAPEVGPKRRAEHLAALDRLGVPLNTGVEIARITREAVVLRRAGGDEVAVAADHVIVAGAVEPDTRLFDALTGRVPELHAVGDCTGLGLIQKAVLDGARAGCAL
jgi:2,4-dienoyl-CoA reductase (NADPH2)